MTRRHRLQPLLRPPAALSCLCLSSCLHLFTVQAAAAAAASVDASGRSISVHCQTLISEQIEKHGALTDEEQELGDDVRALVHRMNLAEALACADVVAQHYSQDTAAIVALATEQIAKHPDCLAELVSKGEAQSRCAQKMYKIAIHFLSVSGRTAAAKAMWDRAVGYRASPDAPPHARIGWTSVQETPTVKVPGLSSIPLRDCHHWAFVETLERNAPQILEEVRAASHNFAIAYPYLTRGGIWQDLFLFRGTEWNHTLCSQLPFTCSLLLPELPTKPGVPRTTVYHEEVVIFRSEPGASVGAHCGSSNGVINLHVTLTGAKGTALHVAGQEVQLNDGKAVCFQDSFFHSVEHAGDGAEERISLVVRVMHPSLSLEAYGDAAATDVVEDLSRWDVASELRKEVGRMREAYRILAAQQAPALRAQVSASQECSLSGTCTAAA